MTNLAEQWSHAAHRPSGRTTRFWGMSEMSFGIVCLAVLAVLAITASLLCPAIDWTATDFLVGP